MSQEIKKKKSFTIKALDAVEKVGNILPNPATLFLVFTIAIMIISFILSKMGTFVNFEAFDSESGKIVEKTVHVVNLFDPESIRHIVSTIVSNFTGFFPLGTVFTIILGVGVAEGTGLVSSILKRIAAVTPKKMVTAIVVFLGIMSNIASSTGYVVLVPLGAILFMGFGRHPIAGLAAAFAGVSGGWSANLLIGTNDPMFAGISTEAAQMIDGSYNVLPTSNWYFMIASTFLITFIGTYITDKVVEPRLGEYKVKEMEEMDVISEDEKRGLRFAGISVLVYIAIILALVLPTNAVLRNPETGQILNSPFMNGIIFFMMLLFLIPGVFYGIGARVIKNDKDVVELMNEAIAGLSSFLVLIFFASQFTALFNYSNLGTVISVKGATFLESVGFVGLPLVIAFIVMTSFINIFIAVDSAKWAIMAPIFVPMFMRLGLSPELTQLAYRIGDSSTNIIAPLMPFFVLIVAFCQKYDEEAGIGTLISTMLPYAIGFLIGWILLFVVWYKLQLPIGPGAPLFYP